ncbi:MAG: Yip1 family protein, partial [Anaerolineae bacterium]
MEPDQDMPFADVTLEPAVADSADGLGVLVLIRDVIVRPRAAMSRLVASPDRRWLFPIVALVIAAGVAAVTGLQVSSEYRDAVAREAVERRMQGRIESGEASEQDVQMALDLASNPVLQAFGVGVAVAAPVVAALVVAAIMHMLGTILGGQQTFTQMFTVTSWARLPLVFGNVLLTVQHLLGRWDPNPRGLSGLVA